MQTTSRNKLPCPNLTHILEDNSHQNLSSVLVPRNNIQTTHPLSPNKTTFWVKMRERFWDINNSIYKVCDFERSPIRILPRIPFDSPDRWQCFVFFFVYYSSRFRETEPSNFHDFSSENALHSSTRSS
jgi:hypothetical protein